MSATLHTSIGAIASSFASGVRDAISFHNVVIFLMTSRTIRNRALQCFLLNGAVFLGSIVLAEYVVIPFLQHLVSADKDTAEIGSIVHSTFTILYQCLWIYPIYAVSFILNSIWYQDIAEYAFVIHGLKSKKVDWSFARWLQSMSEEIYRSLLVGGYFLQITLVSFVPFIGKPVFGLYLSWLYALYSFEYKWSMEQWDLERKLTYFEMRWPYFAGFGFPAALFTFVFPNFVSQGVFALTFPLFIVLAIVSRPVEHYRVVAAKAAVPPNDEAAEPLPTPSASANSAAATVLANASFPHRMPIFREARIVNRVALRACGSCRARRSSAPLATTGAHSAAAAAASLAPNRAQK